MTNSHKLKSEVSKNNMQNYIQTHHFSEWLKTWQEVENELSDKQEMFCVCGKLASGLHESNCKKFGKKVKEETLKRLEHLVPMGISKDITSKRNRNM